ncbi:HAD-IIIC family phosphatase [Xanthobacter autotrophicus]|jgi:FkbH-like protein|uniref:HAD-IIIC family phosphatase n=1 Tax=Xanthobacter autotrophicus TaxID=280 RepID=A0A6C1K933_XANAU|nr:HAD-IIIC family phosphatase [Xanthobacter autotrophicus]
MAAIYRDLAWLPRVQDFREACKRLKDEGNSSAFRKLAGYFLDGTQLNRLASLLRAARLDDASPAQLAPLRLGVIGDGTLDLLLPAIEATGLRHGLRIETIGCNYGQTLNEAMLADSRLNQSGCDAILLAMDHRGLPLSAPIGDTATAKVSVDGAYVLIQDLCAALRKHNPAAHIIVQTIAPPPETLFGHLDRRLAGTPQQMVGGLNRRLIDMPPIEGCVMFDVDALARTVGLGAWHAPTQWNMAKLPFSMDYAPLYADHLCRLLAALKGKSRRVLVLDLDNTVWGGVIGDDGLAGIKIGEGDGTGEAFLSVQKLALSLRDRGIVLAVSSKNTDAVARAAFREHPDMLLREDHIAVFQANWNDKATNIKAIAEELSLGLDSFVFLDDNPAERDLVRQYLPQVAVPELPEDPALYARTLSAAGYFEATLFSEEDRKRAAFYEGNARRASLGQGVASIEDYVAALDMEIDLRPFDAIGRPRIYQLISKSNQFNLTSRRYSEADVKAMEEDPSIFTLQVRLKDRFGDNGMISVVACRTMEGNRWLIDTWLMSCRVLGRGVEKIVLRHLVEAARRQGIAELVGEYRPTERNALVRDHYAQLGFTTLSTGADGNSLWTLATSVEVQTPPVRYANAAPELIAAE